MQVLLVEDHPLFREGLAHALRTLDPGALVFEAADAKAAVALAEAQANIDIVLLDLHLGGQDGLTVIPELRLHLPEAPVLVVSASEEKRDVRRAMQAGARGYLSKSAAPATLIDAMRTVLGGTVFVPALMLGETLPATAQSRVASAATVDAIRLTQREREVLQLLCAGEPNKRIARVLGISDGTVRIHLTAIFRALGVASRTQAMVAAQKYGVLRVGRDR